MRTKIKVLAVILHVSEENKAGRVDPLNRDALGVYFRKAGTESSSIHKRKG